MPRTNPDDPAEIGIAAVAPIAIIIVTTAAPHEITVDEISVVNDGACRALAIGCVAPLTPGDVTFVTIT
ncbi:hypothetical protein TUM17576_08180 [Enterobacter hormaechei]|nr:hypothetical protein TUM17576_08180 [Enterobacter hormaechei]